MKIYSLFICFIVTNLFSFNVYSQGISISLTDTPLQKVIENIEEVSKYRFFYNNNLIDTSKKVSLKSKDNRIRKVLRLLFSTTNIDFKIIKNQIVLFPKNTKTSGTVLENFLNYIEKNKYINDNLRSQSIIKGTVINEKNLPLSGVNIWVKDTNKGSLTNFNGDYEIEANLGDKLVFSYIGFETIETKVTKRTIDIVLRENISNLEEVIVTGYGIQKKNKLTGSMSNINPKIIAKGSRTSIQESIQGNIAGVQVISRSGQPGSTPNVRIRGVGSFQSASPLYVIDGFQTKDPNIIASLNTNDIEAISVLKDAAATSIYGVRGANGVIVIKTKSGISGETQVTYKVETGLSSPSVASRFKALNTKEFQELLVEGVQNAGIRDNDTGALDFLISNGFRPDIDTDWYQLLTRDGLYQQHNISIKGGSYHTRFYLSGGYFNQEGVILASQFERMNTRLKIDHEFTDDFKIDVNITYNKSISKKRPTGGLFANPVRSIYRLRPDISPFNEDGTFNFNFNDTQNPIAQAQEEIQKDINHRILAGAGLSYQIFDGLIYESLISMNQTFQDNFVRLPSGFGDAKPRGRGEQDSNFLFSWLFRNLLRYNLNWKKNNLAVFGGYELQKTRNKFTDLIVENIPDGFEDLNNGSLFILASTNKAQEGLNSMFFNTEYAYNNTYLMSGSIRRDGSSTFGKNNKYAIFWSVGIGWNIANEHFMNSANFIGDLKLRTSYGINGNDPETGIFDLFRVNDYNGNPGLIFTSVGNPNIKWELNKAFNIGMDYSFFNNRIQGSLDWYLRETKDLLRLRPISAANGDGGEFNIEDGNDIADNIGSMQNKGLELNITTQNIISDNDGFNWKTNLSFSKNENKITKLTDKENRPIIDQTRIIALGESIETFYMPRYAGVDQENGNALWYTDDTRTKVTANYKDAKEVIIGKATPDFYAGLRNTFSYKRITLDFQLYTVWGGLVYDTWNRFTNSDGYRRLSSTGNVSRGTFERRWQKPGDITDVPIFVYGNEQSGSSAFTSSRFIYDGSYVRLREATVSYDFPPRLIDKLKLSNFRVYIKGNNLYTFIKDNRLERDPESGYNGRLNQEIPISKTLFLGLNITF
ncbi:SusC/RagA family TonB-linked outer membrane protein [Aquimarina muelleri]|uniref:SusC/RagA family TonB-linked outer membrane protein n=1 Tax=Aquimarina muelleri TaxID=279356 RepID=UPI003F688041